MKETYLGVITKGNAKEKQIKNKEQKKENLYEIRLDNIEEQINEGIKNGTIPVITYREVKIFEEIFYKSELNEEEAKYGENIFYPHDKLIKTVLNSETEVASFLNKYLGLRLKANKLEKYKSNYITKEYNSYESDIVYKIKNKKIFFLIEHQSTIDRTMPYRMHEYTSAIMKEAIDKKEEKKEGYLYPKVISIVIYTGKKKWNVATKLEEIQERLEYYDEIPNDAYKVIDANNYTENELLKSEVFTSKIMFIEREAMRDKNSIADALGKVVDTQLHEDESKELYEIVQYIWGNKVTKEELNIILNKLRKGGKVNMTLDQILDEEYAKRMEKGLKEGRKEGRKEGIKEMIRKMLENNLTIKEISKISGIKEDEIEKMMNV